MEASQFDEISQQLSSSTHGYLRQIKGVKINDKVKAIKDYFQDQSELLLGKQLEESLDKLQKAGGVLKSLGLKDGDVADMARSVVSRARSAGGRLAENAKSAIQDRLSGVKDDAARAVRSKIRGEEPEDEDEDVDVTTADIPPNAMSSGDVASAAQANPVVQQGTVVQNAELEAKTTQESIARGGGSVLGEDRPLPGSVQAASQDQAELQSAARNLPDGGGGGGGAQPKTQAQNERNKQKEEDEDGDGESKFARDMKKATKDTEEEDAVDPEADEATLPLTAILGGISLIASMFTKDKKDEVLQKAQAATSSAVQVGI